jgi:hypothetical protein
VSVSCAPDAWNVPQKILGARAKLGGCKMDEVGRVTQEAGICGSPPSSHRAPDKHLEGALGGSVMVDHPSDVESEGSFGSFRTAHTSTNTTRTSMLPPS